MFKERVNVTASWKVLGSAFQGICFFQAVIFFHVVTNGRLLPQQ
jgi:hypothetical protein